MLRGVIHVGCCGFAMARAKYFATFECVEVNSTFYNLPQLSTAARWRAEAPPHFRFTMKAWQVITHRATSPTYRRTRIDARDREYCGDFGFNPTIRWAWDQTYQVAVALRAELVLFQCPITFRPTAENLERLTRFFTRAKRGKLLFGWEPRGEWPADMIRRLCRDLDLIHVVDPFQGLPVTATPLRYYRLHGHGNPRHRYTAAEFRRLREWCAGRSPVYCLFNNVAMAEDARRFKDWLAESPPTA